MCFWAARTICIMSFWFEFSFRMYRGIFTQLEIECIRKLSFSLKGPLYWTGRRQLKLIKTHDWLASCHAPPDKGRAGPLLWKLAAPLAVRCNFRLICILERWHFKVNGGEWWALYSVWHVSMSVVTSRLIALDYPLGTHTHTDTTTNTTTNEPKYIHGVPLNLCLGLISFLCCYCKTHEGHYRDARTLPSNEIIIETRPQWNPPAHAL